MDGLIFSSFMWHQINLEITGDFEINFQYLINDTNPTIFSGALLHTRGTKFPKGTSENILHPPVSPT